MAQTKPELKQITQTVTSFYLITNIQINPLKSIFVSNSASSTTQFFNLVLESIPASQPFKFLGCWFTLNNKHTQQIKIIQEETLQLTNIASTKKITDKQISYMINTVIILTL